MTDGLYDLENATEALDALAYEEPPELDQDVMIFALDFAMSRAVDPFEGMRLADGFPNLWFGPVPGTRRGAAVLTCTLWVFALEHKVRFDRFQFLSPPF